MANTPKIRFAGYTDEWETRKLGDLLQTLPFKQFLKEPEPDGKYEIIQQGNEPVIGFANGTPCTDYKDVVIFGDHTLSLYKPQRPFFVATDGVRIVKGQQDTDGYYLLSLLERYKPQSEGYKRYYSILADTSGITTYITSEQEKIGVLFKLLDNLITLQQRSIDNLKQYKKYMLSKMFPKDGETVPEIRFAGFTGDWEQRKFGDVVQTRRGLTYKPTDIEENGIRVLRSSNIDEDTFVYGDDDVFVNPKAVNIEPVRKNDILITSANGSSRLVGKHALIQEIPDDSAVHGGFMLLGRTKNYDFVNASMSSSWYTKFINVFVAGGNGAIGNLNKNDLDEQVILVPNDAEQTKIGNYFRNLDHLITLHQRKLDSIKQFKKYMLQNMFPSEA